jgi:hypothetical protein
VIRGLVERSDTTGTNQVISFRILKGFNILLVVQNEIANFMKPQLETMLRS